MVIWHILSSINRDNQLRWIESHPEKKKENKVWTDDDYGIYKADLLASKNTCDIRQELPNTTIIQGDIENALSALIPTDTWIWKTLEATQVLDLLRTRSLQCAHVNYLNRRDTFRNKGDLNIASRWNRYNMYLAIYLNGSRLKCSTRVRGHQCKQMYDWTTHAVNIAKVVKDEIEREKQSRCRLCDMGHIENQMHTSTTCQHQELVYIRNIYRREIENILAAFKHIKLPKKHCWVKNIMAYITQHLWQETETTADIWNDR
jgi:hypothetical protein